MTFVCYAFGSRLTPRLAATWVFLVGLPVYMVIFQSTRASSSEMTSGEHLALESTSCTWPEGLLLFGLIRKLPIIRDFSGSSEEHLEKGKEREETRRGVHYSRPLEHE